MEKIRFKTLEWKFRETGIKYDLVKPSKKVGDSNDVYNIFKNYFLELPNEHFLTIWLSTVNHIQGFDVVSIGTLNSSVVSPREVFRSAIIANSANIILAHNHPSGAVDPSEEDIRITKKLIECGKIMDIHVHDHIIFGKNDYTSLRQRGII